METESKIEKNSENIAPNLYVALLHHPVVNRRGEIIASAVTNLDIHDIARVAKTFCIKGFYVITPYEDQKRLANRIISHWREGFGSEYNPARKRAFGVARIQGTFEDAVAEIRRIEGAGVKSVATCAKERKGAIGFTDFRERLRIGGDAPHVLVFGTAWGLAEEFFERVDYILEPIRGCGKYNHLSVRSAVSIVLDRLVGERT